MNDVRGEEALRIRSPMTPSPLAEGDGLVATDLYLTMTTASSFRVGAKGSYFIVVGNKGPGATNVATTVTDTLPNGLVFDSASGTGWA